MFDDDLTLLPTADLLESAAEHRALANRADARVLEHAVIYADRFHPDAVEPRPGRRPADGRERAVVLGGDGCPEIAEFAIAEFGVVLGVSPGIAARIIGEALALRHRFPFTWARVLSGEATPWKACRIVRDCMKLSEEAARYVDRRIAALIDTISPYRLEKIVKAAKMHVDPDTARAEAAAKVRERGVFIGRSDEHGTKTIYIRTSCGAATRFDAAIAALSTAQQALGDTRSVQIRRAEAVGILADPLFAHELLAQTRSATAPAGVPVPGNSRPEQADQPSAAGSADLAGAVDESSAAADTRAHRLKAAAFTPEPDLNDEADRDAHHPSSEDLADPVDRFTTPADPPDADGVPMDRAALQALAKRLAQIKNDAYTRHASAMTRSAAARPGKTEIYVHLTDHTLATAAAAGTAGDGVVRAEGIGPLLASQLGELIGYGPYTVKPVIDLNDAVSVNCYEATPRIRERVKLTHPVELFPYGTRETSHSIDLDHLKPYDPLGPPDQTSTTNLAPLSRYAHRLKTHAPGWKVRRTSPSTLEWTTPHGFTFHVTPTGTRRVIHPEDHQ
ncbi:hypothetical protein ACI2LF_18205 [Kribbella sp. NPDC020789]